MTQTEIRGALAEIVRKEFRLDEPLPEGTLSEHLDSVQRLILVVAIEDRFKIDLQPEDESAILTLADVVHTIQAKLDAPAAPSGGAGTTGPQGAKGGNSTGEPSDIQD